MQGGGSQKCFLRSDSLEAKELRCEIDGKLIGEALRSPHGALFPLTECIRQQFPKIKTNSEHKRELDVHGTILACKSLIDVTAVWILQIPHFQDDLGTTMCVFLCI